MDGVLNGLVDDVVHKFFNVKGPFIMGGSRWICHLCGRRLDIELLSRVSLRDAHQKTTRRCLREKKTEDEILEAGDQGRVCWKWLRAPVAFRLTHITQQGNIDL